MTRIRGRAGFVQIFRSVRHCEACRSKLCYMVSVTGKPKQTNSSGLIKYFYRLKYLSISDLWYSTAAFLIVQFSLLRPAVLITKFILMTASQWRDSVGRWIRSLPRNAESLRGGRFVYASQCRHSTRRYIRSYNAPYEKPASLFQSLRHCEACQSNLCFMIKFPGKPKQTDSPKRKESRTRTGLSVDGGVHHGMGKWLTVIETGPLARFDL